MEREREARSVDRTLRRIGLGLLLAGLVAGIVGIVRIAIAETAMYSNAGTPSGMDAEAGLLDLAAGVVAAPDVGSA